MGHLAAEFLDISVYNGNRVFFSDVARKLGKFVLDVVRPRLPAPLSWQKSIQVLRSLTNACAAR